jgi:hypothetical protein
MTHDRHNIREALADIVDGRTVKRAKHELLHDGADLTPLFLEILVERGYRPVTVAEVPVDPGERIPAFLVVGTTALFGWVFWEQFTSWKIRKLWGSVIKNARGDWDVQIPEARATVIYANTSLKLEMDIDHPPAF